LSITNEKIPQCGPKCILPIKKAYISSPSNTAGRPNLLEEKKKNPATEEEKTIITFKKG